MNIIDYEMPEYELNRTIYLHRKKRLNVQIADRSKWTTHGMEDPWHTYGYSTINLYYLPITSISTLSYETSLQTETYHVYDGEKFISVPFTNLHPHMSAKHFIYNFRLLEETLPPTPPHLKTKTPTMHPMLPMPPMSTNASSCHQSFRPSSMFESAVSDMGTDVNISNILTSPYGLASGTCPPIISNLNINNLTNHLNANNDTDNRISDCTSSTMNVVD